MEFKDHTLHIYIYRERGERERYGTYEKLSLKEFNEIWVSHQTCAKSRTKKKLVCLNGGVNIFH